MRYIIEVGIYAVPSSGEPKDDFDRLYAEKLASLREPGSPGPTRLAPEDTMWLFRKTVSLNSLILVGECVRLVNHFVPVEGFYWDLDEELKVVRLQNLAMSRHGLEAQGQAMLKAGWRTVWNSFPWPGEAEEEDQPSVCPTWKPESCWDQHPDHSREDWQEEVENGNTVVGYIEWVNNQLEEEYLDNPGDHF